MFRLHRFVVFIRHNNSTNDVDRLTWCVKNGKQNKNILIKAVCQNVTLVYHIRNLMYNTVHNVIQEAVPQSPLSWLPVIQVSGALINPAQPHRCRFGASLERKPATGGLQQRKVVLVHICNGFWYGLMATNYDFMDDYKYVCIRKWLIRSLHIWKKLKNQFV